MVPKSEIARAAGITTIPVAIVWTDKKPEKALEFRQGVWGLRDVAVCEGCQRGADRGLRRDTTTCAGGAMGLGFGRPLTGTRPERGGVLLVPLERY